MNVEIDGVRYVPMSLGVGDEQLRALVRAMIGGYYTQLSCHKDGGDAGTCRDPDGPCSACQLHRLAIQMVGEPPCQKEPLIDELLK